MKLNGNNIILDDDVTLTGEYAGKKLSEVLGGLQTRTSKLERYLKWIYKYGGVGGNGSGSGSSSSSYSIVAKLNGLDISGQSLTLGKTGVFPLEIKINRPEGASFRVVYSYTVEGSTEAIQKSITLDVSNSYTYTTNLELNTNGTLIVTATDSVYAEEKQVSGRYITRSYTIDTNLVNDDGVVQSSEIFTDTAKANGLNIDISYEVSVSATCKYTLTFNTLDTTITTEGQLDLSEKSIRLNLIEIGRDHGWTVTEQNSGYYSGQVVVELNITNQGIVKESFPFNFTLVPSDLYLLVQPAEGNIYINKLDEDTQDIYKFTPGYITLNVRPYKGLSTNTQCTVYYYLEKEGEDPIINTKITSLRNISSIQLYSTQVGWNTVYFKMTCSDGTVYPTESEYIPYYFYIQKSSANIDWPEVGREGKYNYYRSSSRTSAFESFYTLTKGQPYQQTTNKSAITITEFNKPESASDKFNTNIAIGLMYNEVNSDGAVILEGYREGTQQIKVTQSEVVIGNISIPYYLPMTSSYTESGFNYHLLNIVSRLISNTGTTQYYEVIVYVDGIIEGSCSSYLNDILLPDKVVLGSVNCQINLLEVSFPTTQYRTDGSNKVSVPEDEVAYQYYLKYKSVFGGTVDEDDVTLMNYCGALTTDNNGDVYGSYDVVANIASSVDIPTLVFTIDDSEGNQKSYLETSYSEDDTRVKKIEATVNWCPGKGKGELIAISLASFEGARFYIEIQGSSTRSFKCKNYTLSLSNTNEDTQANRYLFSPNFSSSDTTTFLPEESFTLKADVVDSSHSNNTAIGKFVNKVTTKFNTNSTSGPLAGHVKNCLDGFPCLVFIQFVRTNSTTGEEEKPCYYQGVYNFNLGRESFYNLGYKDCSAFYDKNNYSLLSDAGTSFLIYSLEASKDVFKDGLVVAEVQGNSGYFDFSQWDQTILFKQYSFNKETYMFGDIVTGNSVSSAQATTILQNLVHKVALAGGYIFGDGLLRKRFSESPDDYYGYEEGYSAVGDIVVDEDGTVENRPLNQVPNYKYQYKKLPNSTGDAQIYELSGTNVESVSSSNVTELIGDSESEEEIEPWIDYKSLSEYYTICMAFGLVDSVQKNLNIKSWNANPQTGKGKFYLAFYDMDTCLGVNNAGRDTNYFAFSDYWQYSEEQNADDTVTPSSVTVYRDYSPKATNEDDSDYYDVASSYLFAVAKYARYLGTGNTNTDMWPKELWAKWRGATTNSLDASYGCLQSADDFIDNYFGNNLGSVPAPLISANYRNKYLVLSKSTDTSFSTTNFEKFNGTRVAKARDWLDGRLHILDAYFNLPETESPLQYYKKVTGTSGVTYETYGAITQGNSDVINEPSIVGSYNLDNNEDIKIRRDIFSEAGTNQSAVTLNIKVKAKEYSPLIIDLPGSSRRYLLGGDSTYNIIAKLQGMQTYKFMGSGSWTYLDSINTFGFSKLYVNSKYLEELNGTSGNMTISSIDSETGEGGNRAILMPSLTNLTLASSGYTGTLTLVGSNYPNLKTVNIAGSKINLTISDSDLVTVNANNVVADSLTLNGCDSLTTIGLNDVVLGSCTINPIPAAVIKGTKPSSNMSWMSGGLELAPTTNKGIKKLTLVNSEETGCSRLSVTNDLTLTELSVTGFSCVYVSGCPNLAAVYLIDPEAEGKGDKLEQLYINNCGDSASSFVIGNANAGDGVADLEKYTDLTLIRLSSLSKLVQVKLNTDVNVVKYLPYQAFYQNTNLKYISGKEIYVISSETFNQSPNFTLWEDSSQKVMSDIKIHSSCTSLASTFRNASTGISGHITLALAKAFLDTAPTNNGITNISNMFHGQAITYTEDMFIKDLKGTTSDYIDMSKFKKVVDASGAFSYNSISAWHRKWHNVGSDATSVNMNNYMIRGGCVVSTTYDAYYDIIDKITSIGWDYSSGYQVACLKFYNSSGNLITSPTFSNFFHPTDNGTTKHPTKVTTLKQIDFYYKSGMTWNMTGLFANWSGLTTISLFLSSYAYNLRGDVLDGAITGLDTLLNPSKQTGSTTDTLPKLSSIYHSFYLPNHKLNLTSFIDWSTLRSLRCNPFNGIRDYTTSTPSCFNAKKYIIYSNFVNLLGLLISAKSSLTGITNIFRNTTVLLSSSDDPILTLGDNTCTSITNAAFLFFGLKMVRVGDDQDVSNSSTLSSLLTSEGEYMTLKDDIMSSLPNVTDVAGMFRGIKLSSSIPYNFFKRRYSSVRDVYLKTDSVTDNLAKYNVEDYGDGFIKARLYTYDYYRGSSSKAISNMYSCFYGVDWTEDARHFNPTDIERNRIVVTDTGEIIEEEGYVCYTKQSETIELTDKDGEVTSSTTTYFKPYASLSLSTEWTDTLNLEGAHVDSITTVPTGATTQYTIKNFTIGKDSINSLFVAPDIFYPVSSSATISQMFNGSGLEGIIPEHLLKNHSGSFSGVFTNLNIVPRKLGTYIDSDDAIANVYYYVPVGFTNYTTLSECFDFHINLPTATVTNGEGTKEYDAYYIFLHREDTEKGSLPKSVISLSNSLPNTWYGWSESGYPRFNSMDFNIHYGLMFNAEFNDGGELIGGSDGIKMGTYYKSLYVDNLINSTLAFLLSGRMFESSFSLNSIKKAESNYFFRVFQDNNSSYISYRLLFPNATKSFSNQNIIYWSGANPTIRASQIPDASGESTYGYYETIQMGTDTSKRISVTRNA